MIRVNGTSLYVDTTAPQDTRLAGEMRDVLLLQHALTRAMLGDSDATVKATIPTRLHARYDTTVAILRAAP